MKHRSLLLLIVVIAFFEGCFYSFTGSSLPAHLKTVEIPLFSNQSLEPNVADEVTQELSKELLDNNLLKVVEKKGDAELSGSIVSYVNAPYTFGTSDTRQVNVSQYVVRITAEVDFIDKKKDESIYKGTVIGEGIYDLQKSNEQAGKAAAIKELVQRIMQNSVQGW
jgi:23S rRNA A2030 N6-methylase RlmJ